MLAIEEYLKSLFGNAATVIVNYLSLLLRIESWNVDGFRGDCIQELLKRLCLKPDILFLNEIKCKAVSLQELLGRASRGRSEGPISSYDLIISEHVPSHHHGVAMLIRKGLRYTVIPIDMKGYARSDNVSPDADAVRGRFIAVCVEDKINVIGTYVPNSGRKEDSLVYRVTKWDRRLEIVLMALQKLKPTIWIGDINVALHDIDVAAPQWACNYPGFLPSERASFRLMLSRTELVDIWRFLHPTSKEYSWCGYLVGTKVPAPLRLDNCLISKSLISCIVDTYIDQQGGSYNYSDHRPIGIRLQLEA